MKHVETIAQADILRESLQRTSSVNITVAGDSMAPLLRRGDLVGVQRAQPSDIEPGQIVTFADPADGNTLQTHRVASVQIDAAAQPILFTRGDRVLYYDQPISTEQTIGQVLFRQRNGRVLVLDQGPGLWLSNQLGYISERERRLVTGISFPSGIPDADGREASNKAARQRVTSLWVRALRLGSRSWSRVISSFVEPWASEPVGSSEQLF